VKELPTQNIELSLIDCDDLEMSEFIQELSESIKERGLLNPITVQALNGRFKVIAGKKRLKAVSLLGISELPCRVVMGDEKEITLVTIEENLKRTNLPWWEICELVSSWHATKQMDLGASEAKRGKASRENPGWSMRDTAAQLGISLGFVSEAVMLDNAVKRDASLRNIKDRDTAVRLVRNAARRIEAEEDAERPVDFKVDQVYNGSSVDILKRFPDGVFDACITDPPWLRYIDAKLTRDDETVPVFKEVFRVLRPDSFVYLFCGLEDYRSYSRNLATFGFTVSKTPLIWVKKELRDSRLHGVVLSKGARPWEYSRDFELILLAVKGTPSLIESTQQSSVFVFPPLAPVCLTHPNEKPVELIEALVEDCTNEGAIVLDPFAGSGSHLEACKRLSRRWIGIERDRTFYEQVRERLKTGETKINP